MRKVPERYRHLSVDEVAECVAGISESTYDELWQRLSQAEQEGTAKPPGGDGSDGTTEEPIVTSGSYGSDLVAAWPSLSAEARENICACAAEEDEEQERWERARP
jgi:hypothetical protein